MYENLQLSPGLGIDANGNICKKRYLGFDGEPIKANPPNRSKNGQSKIGPISRNQRKSTR